MTPELWGIGLGVTLLLGLLRVIWSMLQNVIKQDRENNVEALALQTKTITETLTRVEASLRSQINDNNNAVSQRLSNGTMRIDGLQKEISDHKERLAREYLDRDEVRMLIQDFITPMKDQMVEIKQLLIASLTQPKKDSQ